MENCLSLRLLVYKMRAIPVLQASVGITNWHNLYLLQLLTCTRCSVIWRPVVNVIAMMDTHVSVICGVCSLSDVQLYPIQFSMDRYIAFFINWS